MEKLKYKDEEQSNYYNSITHKTTVAKSNDNNIIVGIG